MTTLTSMSIDTGTADPVSQKPYPIAMKHYDWVKTEIEKLLAAKVIRSSHSSWSAPIIVVPKGDGGKHLVIDYRALNKVTRKFTWPMPKVEDIFSKLNGATYFTTLDLCAGYHHIPLDKSSIPKTACNSPFGKYEHVKVPFGLAQARAYFQELMTGILKDFPFAMAYLDDIIIFSKTPQEHLTHIHMVFEKLRTANLSMKKSKCNFFLKEIQYLGHILSTTGICPLPSKTQAIRNMNAPTTPKQVRAFLGLVGYYRKFIRGFAKVAKPLTLLTRQQVKFEWMPDHQTAFEHLKNAIVQAPILHYPNPNKAYIVYTDALDDACRAQLSQEHDGTEFPVAFLSHTFSETQCKWSTTEQKAFGVYYAITKWNYYLQGANIIVRNDHKPLARFLNGKNANNKVNRWSLELATYKITFEWISGAKNKAADCLSRLVSPTRIPINMLTASVMDSPAFHTRSHMQSISDTTPTKPMIPQPHFPPDNSPTPKSITEDRRDTLLQMQQMYPFCKCISKWLLNGKAPHHESGTFKHVRGLLYKHVSDAGKQFLALVIPKSWKFTILVEAHDKLGHQGNNCTYCLIRRQYYWKGMNKDIRKYITNCALCWHDKAKVQQYPLQMMEIPDRPFDKIAIDLVTDCETSTSGNKHILTIIDHLTGWPEAFPIPDKSSDTIVATLINHYLPVHMCPRYILLDNGTEFKNNLMDQVLQQLGIDRIFSAPYHPQSNGKLEVLYYISL